MILVQHSEYSTEEIFSNLPSFDVLVLFTAKYFWLNYLWFSFYVKNPILCIYCELFMTENVWGFRWSQIMWHFLKLFHIFYNSLNGDRFHVDSIYLYIKYNWLSLNYKPLQCHQFMTPYEIWSAMRWWVSVCVTVSWAQLLEVMYLATFVSPPHTLVNLII